MASSRKIAANRANARRSTGPRSRSGRLRASLNDLKHGLAVPASAHPALRSEIDQLARLLAGEAADDPVVMVRAVKVAEASIEVQRARRARVELLRAWNLSTGQPNPIETGEPVPDFKPLRREFQELAQAPMGLETLRQVKLLAIAVTSMARVAKLFDARDRAQAKAASASWSRLLRQLERLERYERRALSRRDRAIKEFDRMKTKAMSP